MRLPTGSELTALKVADAVFGLQKKKTHTALLDAQKRVMAAHLLGYQLKCRYSVFLRLYDEKSPMADALMESDSLMARNLVLSGQLPVNWCLRATDVRWPLAAMETESVKAGSMQINRITGSQSPEIEVTFLETRDSDFVKTLKAISNYMIGVKSWHGSGLMPPPAEYALWLTIGLGQLPIGDAAMKGDGITESWSFLVALQSINLDASARETNTLMEIPVTFAQLDPYVR